MCGYGKGEMVKKRPEVNRKQEENHRHLSFLPITTEWQEKTALSLGVAVEKAVSFSTLSTGIKLGVPVQRKDVRPDGNCGFRCMSFLVTGSEENHSVFRQLVVDHMEKHSDNHMRYFSGHDEFISHLKVMRNDMEWVTEAELFALSSL